MTLRNGKFLFKSMPAKKKNKTKGQKQHEYNNNNKGVMT
jgi:hypothetical protein